MTYKCIIVLFMVHSFLVLGSFELIQPGFPKNSITIVKEIIHKQRSFITFVLDEKNKKLYLIKQGQPCAPSEQFCAIREMLAGHVLESMKIPANRVRLLPVQYAFPGKPDTNRPATIHTVVPGKPASCAQPLYNINLRQRVSRGELGLRLQTLRDLAIHPVLSKIVAADTFLANIDRHRANLFYDPKSNAYFAIDHEHSFVKPLGYLACQSIAKILRLCVVFTHAEQQGIIRYRDMLKKLLKCFPPRKLHGLLYKFVQQSKIALYIDNPILLKKIMDQYGRYITTNYEGVKRLVILLDDLIKMFPRQEKSKVHYQNVIPYDGRSISQILKVYEMIYGKKRI